MEKIGIICEYNPFHNGHKYHINKIKEMYPDSLIILVLNGYFLERGEISILTKEEKVKIALNNNIDIVVELPFVFGSQSADTFSESASLMLNYLGCNKLIFGSESNDIKLLTKIANKQLNEDIHNKIKSNLKSGLNYPTALNKTLEIDVNTPNDLLGISYIKAILKNKLKLEPITIKRTNNYHDIESNEDIISASNIREKIKNNQKVDKYTNYAQNIVLPNMELLFNLLKYKIITDANLNKYLTVDEGIENKLLKEVNNVNSVDELIQKVKSKRYTYNRLQRMLIHILIGLTKENRNKLDIEYIKVLGFNKNGQKYLKTLKCDIPVQRKISDKYLAQKYELKASKIYDMLTGEDTLKYELNNRPIKANGDLNEKR